MPLNIQNSTNLDFCPYLKVGIYYFTYSVWEKKPFIMQLLFGMAKVWATAEAIQTQAREPTDALIMLNAWPTAL